MARLTLPKLKRHLYAAAGTSRSTLYKLAQDGKLPGQKVGRRWRFHKDAIGDWLTQHPERGKKQ